MPVSPQQNSDGTWTFTYSGNDFADPRVPPEQLAETPVNILQTFHFSPWEQIDLLAVPINGRGNVRIRQTITPAPDYYERVSQQDAEDFVANMGFTVLRSTGEIITSTGVLRGPAINATGATTTNTASVTPSAADLVQLLREEYSTLQRNGIGRIRDTEAEYPMEPEPVPDNDLSDYMERQRRIEEREVSRIRTFLDSDERNKRGDEEMVKNRTRPEGAKVTCLCDWCYVGLTSASKIRVDGFTICPSCEERLVAKCAITGKKTMRRFLIKASNGRGNALVSREAIPMLGVCTRCEYPAMPKSLINGVCHDCNGPETNATQLASVNGGEYDEYSDELPYRSFDHRILTAFCSPKEELGRFVASPRIFSAEIECQYPTREIAHHTLLDMPQAVGVGSDGSISARGVEIQTPKLRGKNGEALVFSVCRKLIGKQFTTDKSCGLHIHLDGGKAYKYFPTERTSDSKRAIAISNLFAFYILFDDVFMSFLPVSRRKNTYCNSMRTSYSLKDVFAAKTCEDLEKIWYRASTPSTIDNRKSNSKDPSRYSGVNMHTLFSDNHLEIRYHSGTINPVKILEWVNLHARVMDVCASNPNTLRTLKDAVDIIDLNEKTELMLNFLGLNPRAKAYWLSRQQKFASRKDALAEDTMDVADTEDNADKTGTVIDGTPQEPKESAKN